MRIEPGALHLTTARGFIVLDGVNGAGKSTLLARIMEYLKSRSIAAIQTREPGATALGKTLRSLLLDPATGKKSHLAEMFLFAADRNQHVNELIRPALAQGTCVVSDRYYYSTEAFQGYGRGLNLETVRQVNSLAIDGCLPDFTLILDLDPVVGLARTKGRSADDKDAFELEEVAFHTRLRQGFLEIAERVPEPCLVLDASRSPDEVFSMARIALDKWIEALHRKSIDSKS